MVLRGDPLPPIADVERGPCRWAPFLFGAVTLWIDLAGIQAQCQDIVLTWGVSMATAKSEKLDLRLSADAKRTLQMAAAAAGRSVSDFVLESAMARAEESLPDRRYFTLSPEQWEAFQNALDAPPRPMPRMERLLRTKSVFEDDGE